MEKRALFLMLLAIALWMTDLIHHISPAIIGIGIGLLACVARRWHLESGRHEAPQLSPRFFCSYGHQHGNGAGADWRPAHHDRDHVLIGWARW